MRKLFYLMFLFSVPAYSQAINFVWDLHPEAAQLSGFNLYQSKAVGGPYTSAAMFTPGTATAGSIPKPGLGRYCFVLTATTPDAIESDYSNEVCTVLKPKAPVLRSVMQAIAMAPVHAVKGLLALFSYKTLKLKKG